MFIGQEKIFNKTNKFYINTYAKYFYSSGRDNIITTDNSLHNKYNNMEVKNNLTCEECKGKIDFEGNPIEEKVFIYELII